VAPLAIRRTEPAPSPDADRDTLGPALCATPLVTVGRWRCPPWHPVFVDSGPARGHLFVFPRSSVFIQHEGGRRFVADPAVVTYYNRGQRYRRQPLSPIGDRGEWYAIVPSVLAEVLSRRDPAARDRGERLFAITHGPCDRRSYVEQRAVFEHVRREAEPDALFVDETMLGVLERVVGLAASGRSAADRTPSRTRRDLAERARGVLAVRFAEAMSLQDLARATACSPFHLARVFRDATGHSLHGYRSELRLRAALDRLGDAGTDLLDLALTLGYSSHSHFTEAFRAAFGQTPSNARHRLTRGRARDLALGLASMPTRP
jgi:AraC family transcriptional regulator